MISSNVTELQNFRPGFFELQIKEIGIYTGKRERINVAAPATLSKEEAEAKKPILLKVLRPLAKVFFSEKRYVKMSGALFGVLFFL